MKTEEVINALTTDGARPVVPIARTLWRALGIGTALSLVIFDLILQPRADVGQAIRTVPFDFKLGVFALAGLVSVQLLAETARPLSAFRWRRPLLAMPILLLAAVVVELVTVPAAAWGTRLLGHNAGHCVAFVPLLSLPPVVCLLAALRRGAPQHPALAGAVAGLVSGSVGALLYALSCPDDSPLFIATWYGAAIAIVTGLAAYTGRHWLRW